jgi:hypothetical protein
MAFFFSGLCGVHRSEMPVYCGLFSSRRSFAVSERIDGLNAHSSAGLNASSN